MIRKYLVDEWRQTAPWANDSQVEQDLIISRALIDLFSDPLIQSSMVFRGGTALNKLVFKPSARFSEDIDLVQIQAAPIGPVINAIRKALNWIPIILTSSWQPNCGLYIRDVKVVICLTSGWH